MRWTQAAAVLALAAALGCQTMPKLGKKEAPETAAAPALAAFRPAAPRAELEFVRGNYPALYSEDSFAIWVDERAMEAKHAEAVSDGELIPPKLEEDAKDIVANFIVIECHMTSAFPDMSIGYDAVSFRKVEAALVLPSGARIAPVQRVLGRMTETGEGAIKVFSRINLLIFPRKDLLLDKPLGDRELAGAKLTLEAAGAEFAFDWANLSGDAPAEGGLVDKADLVRVGFVDLFQTLRRLAHVFD